MLHRSSHADRAAELPGPALVILLRSPVSHRPSKPSTSGNQEIRAPGQLSPGDQNASRESRLTRSGLADTPAGADLAITAEEYGLFLVRMFDAWFDDPKRMIGIEPFAQHISRILGETVTHSCF